jgi:hypothetical protein
MRTARGYARTYVFADGHSEIHTTPDGNFEKWETEHTPPVQGPRIDAASRKELSGGPPSAGVLSFLVTRIRTARPLEAKRIRSQTNGRCRNRSEPRSR